VTLRSGGYLVINQTEALVAVDVNSGKATREFSIEETALQTNLEAADEVARQVKLRDLAGLIVIDFIDMEERRNNRKVENRLKDALRHDRARIQVGRISHFGLLEMSRQRLRTGVMEGSTSQCPHCQGTGIVRSTESVALAVLRALEDHLVRDSRSSLTAVTNADVALYILNNKRSFVTEMEHSYGVSIAVQAGERMHGANFAIERSAAPVAPQRAAERSSAVNMEWAFESEPDEELQEVEEVEAQGEGEAEAEAEAEEERRPRRRRRRGRGEDRAEPTARGERRSEAGRFLSNGEAAHAHASDDDMEGAPELGADAAVAEIPGLGEQPAPPLGDDEERRGRRRRRGRRGGRRGREREDGEAASDDAGEEHAAPPVEDADAPAEGGEVAASDAPAAQQQLADDRAQPEPQGEPETPVLEPREVVNAAAGDEPPAHSPPTPEATPPAAVEPASTEPAPAAVEPSSIEPAHAVETDDLQSDPLKPARKGWWQRRATVE
jgi:ribonuclease E